MFSNATADVLNDLMFIAAIIIAYEGVKMLWTLLIQTRPDPVSERIETTPDVDMR